MSCEVAALPFQAHANYGPWSIDFEFCFGKLLIFIFLTFSFYFILLNKNNAARQYQEGSSISRQNLIANLESFHLSTSFVTDHAI